VIGNQSPVDSPLMDVIKGWVASVEPEARVVPTILPGFTDSRTFRDTFPDLIAYGFFPHREMTLYEAAPLIHSANERIPVADLGTAADFFVHAAREICG
jgi:acetylornithine deacetylase/succinyl-diaminopimelate desuccinylase-like protein